ncbi:hypothetical protein ACOMHN_054766 [Nucella lapillus]
MFGHSASDAHIPDWLISVLTVKGNGRYMKATITVTLHLPLSTALHVRSAPSARARDGLTCAVGPSSSRPSQALGPFCQPIYTIAWRFLLRHLFPSATDKKQPHNRQCWQTEENSD